MNNNLETKFGGKRNAVVGTLNQAKGVAREKLGQATNNPGLQLSGKKDQVVGALQKSVGTTWAYQHKGLLTAFAAALAIIAAMVYYMNRSNDTSVTGSRYGASYTQ